MPLFFAAPGLASGQLVAVLPEQVGGQVQIAVVYPERELVPPIVRVFVDELVAWGRKEFVELAEIEGKCPKHGMDVKQAAGRRKRGSEPGRKTTTPRRTREQTGR